MAPSSVVNDHRAASAHGETGAGNRETDERTEGVGEFDSDSLARGQGAVQLDGYLISIRDRETWQKVSAEARGSRRLTGRMLRAEFSVDGCEARTLAGCIGELAVDIERPAELDDAEDEEKQERGNECELDEVLAATCSVRHGSTRISAVRRMTSWSLSRSPVMGNGIGSTVRTVSVAVTRTASGFPFWKVTLVVIVGWLPKSKGRPVARYSVSAAVRMPLLSVALADEREP